MPGTLSQLFTVFLEKNPLRSCRTRTQESRLESRAEQSAAGTQQRTKMWTIRRRTPRMQKSWRSSGFTRASSSRPASASTLIWI